MVCLWICAGSVLRCFFAKCAAFFVNASQFGETCHVFTGKVPQSLNCLDCGVLQDGTLSGSAVHTQRDKRGARYAALISVAAACLLHDVYRT